MTRLTAIEQKVDQQAAEITILKKQAVKRDDEVENLKSELAVRDSEIAMLKAKLGKNLGNSSKPPSSDSPDFKRNQSRRDKSNRKQGGQANHKGSTLKMIDVPDEVILCAPPSVCDGCGTPTTGVKQHIASRHQTFDPPPLVTEHRVMTCTCGNCGRELRGQLPEDVSTAPTSYGKRLTAYIAYLSVRHYLPYARLAELVRDFFGISLPTGTIANMLARKTAEFDQTIQQIKSAISRSEVVAADETYIREKGKKAILWIWCTTQYLYLARGPNRAFEVVEREWPDGLLNSIITSDRWSPQLKTPSAAKQVCIHHLLRESRGLQQRDDASKWSSFVTNIFKDIVKLGAYNRRCYSKAYQSLQDDLDEVLDEKWLSSNWLNAAETKLFKGLRRVREHLTTCLTKRNVPPDNDDAERGIRGAKVKRNVSNQFRSSTGTQQYCTIRSIVGTALRQRLSPIDVLMGNLKLTL